MNRMRVRFGTAAVALLAVVASGGASTATASGAGALDPSFAGDGATRLSFLKPGQDGDGATASEVMVNRHGKIITAGIIHIKGRGRGFALARQKANSDLDPRFSRDGKVTTFFSHNISRRVYKPVTAVPAGAGRILVAGTAGGGFALARYQRNGQLDDSFGGDGKVRTTTPGPAVLHDLFVEPSGNIVAAGLTEGSQVVLVRYLPDGSLDASFDGDGQVVREPAFPRSGGHASTLAVQPDGKVVVAGRADRDDPNTWNDGSLNVLARYNADGTRDLSFGEGGESAPVVSERGEDAVDLVFLPNAKIVVLGRTDSTECDGDLCDGGVTHRYHPDGTEDAAYESDYFKAHGALAVQADGKLIVTGDSPRLNLETFSYDEERIETLRLRRDGSFDATFGDGGRVYTSFTRPGSEGERLATDAGGRAVAIQPDGKIIVAGYVEGSAGLNSENSFAVVRYLGD